MKQKRSLLLIVLLSVILILEIVYCLQKYNIITTMSFNASTNAELKNELIISLFSKNIESDSSLFYNNYFSSPLEYFNYETKIIKVKQVLSETHPTIDITFRSTPMIGAHNPVGYDELVYKVDVLGNITLDKFTHLKSFDIPERLRTDMIKPYPETK